MFQLWIMQDHAYYAKRNYYWNVCFSSDHDTVAGSFSYPLWQPPVFNRGIIRSSMINSSQSTNHQNTRYLPASRYSGIGYTEVGYHPRDAVKPVYDDHPSRILAFIRICILVTYVIFCTCSTVKLNLHWRSAVLRDCHFISLWKVVAIDMFGCRYFPCFHVLYLVGIHD